ncbi:protein TAPETUM DETERMINANT 1 [Setaria italica]|nr:protein TAPETUM DETERMINANT 1 [Setaria italica]XP_034569882.1 protein TAPETUM DETERMINANT 1-like [Setaria viridis]
MACATKATIILFLAFVICCQADTDRPGACKLSDLHISVVKTGKEVQGQPEYQVTIDNQCSCAQAIVTVHCDGLPSVEPVDEGKIRTEDGGVCLVNDGLPIAKGSPVVFTFAGKTAPDFAPTMAVPHC